MPSPFSGAVAHINDAAKVLVKDGELRCWLSLPGAADDEWVAAVVRIIDGEVVTDLWESAQGWPTEFERRGRLTLHGVTVTDRKLFTLLGGRVNRLAVVASGYEARRLRAQTLVLGVHADETTTWSCLCLQTARLHEWLAGEDVTDEQEYNETPFSIEAHVHQWRRSEPARLQRDDAEVLFAPRWEAQGGDGPDFTIRTQTDLVVRPKTPLTISEFNRQYGLPLLALMTLASSGPDGVVYERVSDRDRNEAATIIHSGNFRVEPRPWDRFRISNRFLFTAADIEDPIALLGRWLDLWPKTHDAILTFGDTFRAEVYTRSRVLALAVALEAYWRIKFLQPGEDEHRTNLIDKYKRVYRYTRVKAKVMATNDDQLQGLVAARHLYAHLKQRNTRFDEDQIDEALIDNARRAAVLFQAALLRDLDIAPKTITQWIERHTKNWPLS